VTTIAVDPHPAELSPRRTARHMNQLPASKSKIECSSNAIKRAALLPSATFGGGGDSSGSSCCSMTHTDNVSLLNCRSLSGVETETRAAAERASATNVSGPLPSPSLALCSLTLNGPAGERWFYCRFRDPLQYAPSVCKGTVECRVHEVAEGPSRPCLMSGGTWSAAVG
jgi:hypothetical protein